MLTFAVSRMGMIQRNWVTWRIRLDYIVFFCFFRFSFFRCFVCFQAKENRGSGLIFCNLLKLLSEYSQTNCHFRWRRITCENRFPFRNDNVYRWQNAWSEVILWKNFIFFYGNSVLKLLNRTFHFCVCVNQRKENVSIFMSTLPMRETF